MSAMLSRESGKFNSAGSSHANALIETTTPGGKARRTASPVALLKAFQAMFEEAFPPLTYDLKGCVQSGSNILVLHSLGGIEHDFSPNYVNIR
jgi:hypothetical protein